MKNEKHNDRFVFVLEIFFTVVYLFQIIQAAVGISSGKIDSAEARLILFQGIGGLVLSWLPLWFVLLFHIKLHPVLICGIELFGFMGIYLGEAWRFYYLFPVWDDILHTFSGFGIAFLAFCFLYAFLFKEAKNVKHPIVLSCLFACLISIALGTLWEAYEFAGDTFLGLNMQKSIPEGNALWNGGATNLPLNGSDEEIAAFFRSPEGYRYALMDTMGDIVEDVAGNVVFALGAALALGAFHLKPRPLVFKANLKAVKETKEKMA